MITISLFASIQHGSEVSLYLQKRKQVQQR